MKATPRWLVHKAKAPFYANGTARGATDTRADRTQLVGYAEACAARDAGGYDGIGFALGPDDAGGHWQGIDLDDIEANALSGIANALPGYVERSPGKKGCHAIGYGAAFDALGANASGVEAYSRGRYFTVTERVIRHAPLTDLAPTVRQVLTPLHRREVGCDVARTAGEAGGVVMEGARNDFLSRKAYGLRKDGASVEQISSVLLAMNDKLCSPPVSVAEVRKIAKGKQRIAPDPPSGRNPVTIAPLQYVRARDIRRVLDIPYAVKGLLNLGTVGAVYGDSNTGKSFFVLHLATAVAAGRPIFGRKTAGGAVLYIAGEGATALLNRVALLTEEYPNMPLVVVQQGLFLNDERRIDEERVVAAAREVEAEYGCAVHLVAIDTVARNMRGDENSIEIMGEFVKTCERIAKTTGAVVLVVHHTGKDATRGLRGHSSLHAALDTEILVEGRRNPRLVTCPKQRDLPTFAPVRFDLVTVELGRDSEGDVVTTCRVEECGASEAPKVETPRDQAKRILPLIATSIARLRADGHRTISRSLLEADPALHAQVSRGPLREFIRLAVDQRWMAETGAGRSKVLTITESGFAVGGSAALVQRVMERGGGTTSPKGPSRRPRGTRKRGRK